MDSHLKSLASLFLKKAADEFSYHGCNDFDLEEEGGLSMHEVIELRRAFTKANGDEHELIQDEIDTRAISDSSLMSWLASLLLDEANS